MGFSLFFLVFKRFSFHLHFLSLQLQNVLITVLSASYKREETPSISVGMNLNSCFHLLRAQFFSILIKPNTSVIRVIRRKQDWKKESLHFFFPVSYIITPFTSPMGSTFLLPYFFFSLSEYFWWEVHHVENKDEAVTTTTAKNTPSETTVVLVQGN